MKKHIYHGLILFLVFCSCKKHEPAASGSCNAATALSITGITASGAVMSWTAATGSISYIIEFRPANSQTWQPAGAATTATFFSIGSLNPGTTYDIRVGSNCTGGSTNYLNGQFTTAIGGGGGTSCGAPTGFTSSNITSAGASVGWIAAVGAVSYSVEYSVSGSGTWISAGGSTSATSFILTGLSSGTSYSVRVSANCTAGISNYLTGQLTTLGSGGGGGGTTCNGPTGFTSSNISSAGATISWSAATGANSYTVEFSISGSGVWISAGPATTATSIMLNNLSAGTTYDVRIRTNCGNSTSNYLTGQVTTSGSGTSCIAPTGLLISNITPTSAVVSWTASAGAITYAVRYRISGGSGGWTSAGATSTTSISLSGLASATSYQVKIVATCSGGESNDLIGSFTTIP